MSAVSLLSSGREKSTNQSPNDGSQHEGHEEGAARGGVGGGGGDPAVLAVGPARRPITYSRDELMKLRHSPLVKNNLEHAFAGCDALALVLKKRSDSPNEEDRGGRGDAPGENQKQGVYVVTRERERERSGNARCADPRERVRKESEPSAGGIVLSPQRRSFTSGCGAPVAAVPPQPPHVARTRPESPLATAPPQHHQPKPDAAGARRIGSGRIMVRDDVREGAPREPRWEEPAPRAEPYRPPAHQRLNGERFERRSFGRDSYSSDIKRERDDRFINEKLRDSREDNRRSGGRYSQRRFEKEDEPEWFSGGPTSQLETIELRGFDEPVKKNGNANNKETDDNADVPQKSGKQTGPTDRKKWNNGSRSPADRWRDASSPIAPPHDSPNTSNNKWNNGSRSPADRWRDASSPIAPPHDSPNTSNNKWNNGSRSPADRWRDSSSHKSSPSTNNDKDSGVESKTEEPAVGCDQPEFNLDEFLKFDSIPEVLTNGGGETEGGSRFSQWFRRESPTTDRHYERLLHNMVDDLDGSGRQAGGGGAGGEAAHVFAPISPARPHAPHPPPSLMDLLMRANEPAPEVNPAGGKIHSLEELEARLRPQHPHSVPDHDLTAFKQLLAQVSGGHAVTAEPRPQPHHQPMTLLQMLNKSMEQQQKQQQQQHHQQQHHQQQQQQQQPHIPQDLLYKLLQVQQRQQQQQQQNEMNAHLTPTDRDLLQRPEAQAILHGLKCGEITGTHLMQQLGNPGLQSRHREMLLTILRTHHHQRQMGGSPLPMGAAPHLVVPPHHQPLRLSPLPHQGGVPARIPSPRELAVHTQSIMQNALIKKKLEEQRENYNRRRQDLHHQPKQPTPISFTPTSVLRKMTAEKEADALSPKQQQWAQPPKMPQMGRPIVKGNQSGAPSMGYAPQADYQQHYMNQQQMISGVRQFPHQSQRQQVTNSYNNMNNMARGMPANTTLHQLLVQSHQRSLNEMANSAGVGGGDNQLARWFSPELLARASAGKLPSVHVPNALSLEDLERHHHSPAPPVRN